MHHQPSGGVLELICGSMFSGKTEELLRRVRRAEIARKRVQLFKPRIDNRYGISRVVSHNGVAREDVIVVERATDILSRLNRDTEVVAVDEVQFFDWKIADICDDLADRGLRVIAAGLDQDFRGEPFGPMPLMLAIAERVDKLWAICVACGAPASRTQRLIDGRPALSGHLPPAPQGWVRRAYLRSDGEAITAGAGALGWTARLRAAGDLERFGVFAQSGPDQMVKVLANGETRIAIGLRRPPKMLKADRTPWAVATLVGEEKMEVDAVVEAAGLKFERRARALPDTGAPMPYDVYRGRGPGGLEIEVLTNAPAETVAATLAGLVVLQR